MLFVGDLPHLRVLVFGVVVVRQRMTQIKKITPLILGLVAMAAAPGQDEIASRTLGNL